MNTLFNVPTMKVDEKYTRKVQPPQYVPNNVCPPITALCDKTRYGELMRKIKNADIPEDVRTFLQFAATRHIVFNYSNIADYYAHTTPEIQRLMEESALVIIDIYIDSRSSR